MKKSDTEREEIYANDTPNNGLIPKTYKEFLQPNIKKSTQLNMTRWFSQIFFQRRHRDGQQAHKRCLASLTIKEMQIKVATRYHFTPVRKTIIKKTINNKHWQGCKEIGKSVHCWEYNLLLPLTVRRFLKKFIIE